MNPEEKTSTMLELCSLAWQVSISLLQRPQ